MVHTFTEKEISFAISVAGVPAVAACQWHSNNKRRASNSGGRCPHSPGVPPKHGKRGTLAGDLLIISLYLLTAGRFGL